MSGQGASGERCGGPSGPALYAALLGVTLAAYLPALRGSFLWDDDAHVTRASLRSLAGLGRIWWDLGATQQYYPVLHSAFWLEHRLWGDAVLGYHLVNVVLHATAAWLFVQVLEVLGLGLSRSIWGGASCPQPARSTTGASARAEGSSRHLDPPSVSGLRSQPSVPASRFPLSASVFAGFLFALHPVCVESVAWISEQKNTLSLVFYLLSALVYLKGSLRRGDNPVGRRDAQAAQPGSGGSISAFSFQLPAFFFFLLALLSKSVTATLPAALLVILWWKKGRLNWRADVLPLVPFLVAGLASGLFTAWVERHFVGARGAPFDLGAVGRVLLAGRVSAFYLGKLLWPANLIFIYPHWTVDTHCWWQYLFPVGAASVLVLLGIRRFRGALAGCLFFVGSLVPALGFVNVFPFLYSYVADHFQYLPSLGILALVAAGWGHAAGAAQGAVARRAWALGGVGVLAILGVLTWRQCRAYRDPIVFYSTIVERNPGAWMAHNNLGEALADAGRRREAAAHYREAVRLRPEDAEAQNNLGIALVEEGSSAEAIGHYRRALEIEPDRPEILNNLGIALAQLGRTPEAIACYRRALMIRPGYAEAWYNLGDAEAADGRPAQATGDFSRAIALNPGMARAHNDLGDALAQLGRPAEALAQYEEAVRLEPRYPAALGNLGLALAQAGRPAEAAARFEAAIGMQPGNPELRNNLGCALAQLGRVADARREFGEALRLRPGDPEALANLARLGPPAR